MLKACKQCDGTGKIEIQRQNFETGEMMSVGVSICMSCDGTGLDRDWHERACADCGQTFGYNINWVPAPILCPECQAKYKTAPAEKTQSFPARRSEHERGQRSSGNGAGYRRDQPAEQTPGEWREKACQQCGTTFQFNTQWKPEPLLCKACYDKKKAQRAGSGPGNQGYGPKRGR